MSSKFSGILAQARHRPTEDLPENDEAIEDALSSTEHPLKIQTQQHSSPAVSIELQNDPPTVDTPSRGRPRGKRSDPNFTQITAYISKKTHQEIKLALLREGSNREISQLIEQCLTKWLEEMES